MAFLFILGILFSLLLGWELNERLLERKRLAERCIETIGQELTWVSPANTHLSTDASQRRFRRLNLGLLQDGLDHLKASPFDHQEVITQLQTLQRAVLRAQWKLDKGKMTEVLWRKDIEEAIRAFQGCKRALQPNPIRVMRTWIGL